MFGPGHQCRHTDWFGDKTVFRRVYFCGDHRRHFPTKLPNFSATYDDKDVLLDERSVSNLEKIQFNDVGGGSMASEEENQTVEGTEDSGASSLNDILPCESI